MWVLPPTSAESIHVSTALRGLMQLESRVTQRRYDMIASTMVSPPPSACLRGLQFHAFFSLFMYSGQKQPLSDVVGVWIVSNIGMWCLVLGSLHTGRQAGSGSLGWCPVTIWCLVAWGCMQAGKLVTRCAEPYAEGDLVSVQLDMDQRHIKFLKNGVAQGLGDGLPGGRHRELVMSQIGGLGDDLPGAFYIKCDNGLDDACEGLASSVCQYRMP
eukprot:1158472-Pelagomonas_calceolata.AAC.12